MSEVSFSLQRLLRPSHRTLPEQTLGLAIFLVTSFSFELLNRWFVSFSFHSEWYDNLTQLPWAFESWPTSSIWAIYHLLLSLSMWSLWRRFSLRTLKLELSIYSSQFLFQAVWCASFFALQETLLALVGLLLLLSTTILSALLFGKRNDSQASS